MWSPTAAAPVPELKAFERRSTRCRHRPSFPSQNPRSMVCVSGLSGMELGRAPSGMVCREPSLRLGPPGFQTSRLRAPLARTNLVAQLPKVNFQALVK